MQAARLVEGTVAVETVEIPEPKPGEARLKIIQGGVCNTDVELTRGCVRPDSLFLDVGPPTPSALKDGVLKPRVVAGRYKGGGSAHTIGHEFVARVDKLNNSAASMRPCHSEFLAPLQPSCTAPRAQCALHRCRSCQDKACAYSPIPQTLCPCSRAAVSEGQRVVAEINCVPERCGKPPVSPAVFPAGSPVLRARH